ncbi:MAG: V-type ATP synthase subunit D [Candidatus Heimdallarchaeaceae archaeon]
MRETIAVPATKSNLLLFEKKLKLVDRAYNLLREKYDALLLKLDIISTEIVKLRNELEKKLHEAYVEFVKTESEIGREMLDIFAETTPKGVVLSSKPVEYMGIVYSDLEIEQSVKPSYGFFGVSGLLWLTAARFQEVFVLLVQLAEVENMAYKLISNIQSLLLILNALDKVYRKRFTRTIKVIKEALESAELEEIFMLKKLKEKMERKTGGKR